MNTNEQPYDTIDDETKDDPGATWTMETSQEVQESIPLLNDKQQALLLLRDNGLSIPDAAKVLGYNKDYAYHTAKKLSKHNLSSGKLIKPAYSVVKNILEGKTWGCIDKIKDSSALAAAQMIYDRVDPKINQNLNINVNIPAPVELDRWKK